MLSCEIAIAQYAKEEGKPEKIAFKFKDGRGRFEILTDRIFGFSQKETKILFGMLDTAEDRENIINTLQNYAAFALEKLNKWYELEAVGPDLKEAAKIKKVINKYTTFSKMLSDRYGTEAAAGPEKLTFRRAEVFEIFKKEIRTFSGWTFEKDGIPFTFYKSPADKKIYLILAAVGLAAGTLDSKNEIDVYLTQKIDTFKKIIKAESFQESEKIFAEAMKEAGFYASYKTRPELSPISGKFKKPAADPAPEKIQAEEKPAADPVQEKKSESVPAPEEKKPERIQAKAPAPKRTPAAKKAPKLYKGRPLYTRVWSYAG